MTQEAPTEKGISVNDKNNKSLDNSRKLNKSDISNKQKPHDKSKAN
jgi:hypothetical protein